MPDNKPHLGEIVTIREWEDLASEFWIDRRDTKGDLILTDFLVFPRKSPLCGKQVRIDNTEAGYAGEYYGTSVESPEQGLWFTAACTVEYKEEQGTDCIDEDGHTWQHKGTANDDLADFYKCRNCGKECEQ